MRFPHDHSTAAASLLLHRCISSLAREHTQNNTLAAVKVVGFTHSLEECYLLYYMYRCTSTYRVDEYRSEAGVSWIRLLPVSGHLRESQLAVKPRRRSFSSKKYNEPTIFLETRISIVMCCILSSSTQKEENICKSQAPPTAAAQHCDSTYLKLQENSSSDDEATPRRNTRVCPGHTNQRLLSGLLIFMAHLLVPQ